MLCFPMLISSLPGANPSLPEHKNGIFVSEWAVFPRFTGFPSTKSGFLCAFGVRNPRFRAFRAQNRVFCALLPAERAERTRRDERAGEVSSQKKEGGQSGHPLEFCISAVGLLTLCLQVSCKMQGGVLQTPL